MLSNTSEGCNRSVPSEEIEVDGNAAAGFPEEDVKADEKAEPMLTEAAADNGSDEDGEVGADMNDNGLQQSAKRARTDAGTA